MQGGTRIEKELYTREKERSWHFKSGTRGGNFSATFFEFCVDSSDKIPVSASALIAKLY